MSTPILYVVGFCFTEDHEWVVLIKKIKPEWQAGRYNGVGGKVEPGETPHQAMSREFAEETGVGLPPEEWEHTGTMVDVNWTLYIFRAFSDLAASAKTMEEEEVRLVHPPQVPDFDTISNLRWLVPYQLDPSVVGPTVFPHRQPVRT